MDREKGSRERLMTSFPLIRFLAKEDVKVTLGNKPHVPLDNIISLSGVGVEEQREGSFTMSLTNPSLLDIH